MPAFDPAGAKLRVGLRWPRTVYLRYFAAKSFTCSRRGAIRRANPGRIAWAAGTARLAIIQSAKTGRIRRASFPSVAPALTFQQSHVATCADRKFTGASDGQIHCPMQADRGEDRLASFQAHGEVVQVILPDYRQNAGDDNSGTVGAT